MSYVVVEDVAASWEQYQRFADALAGQAPAGLVVHAAGPTEEGFRIVAVWESEEAWRRFVERVGSAERSSRPHEVLRAFRSEHVVYGDVVAARLVASVVMDAPCGDGGAGE